MLTYVCRSMYDLPQQEALAPMAKTQPANIDTATGLPGPKAFAQDWAEAVASGDTASAAIIDLDLFGKVNAAHGRPAGDAVLRAMADALREQAGPRAMCYRFGGDAFAVLLHGIEKEQAFLTIEAFRSGQEKLAARKNGKSGTGAVTISAGVAAVPDDGAEAEAVMHKAFEALYRAKVSGRNKTCLAREERMVTKTSHYTQGQLMGLRRLAEREKLNDAQLLREALNDLLRKYNA